MPTCDLCGAKLANSAEGRKNHQKLYHGVMPKHTISSHEWNGRPIVITSIKPCRTTTRTHLEIVTDMEKMFGCAVMPSVQPWHGTADRDGYR